MGYESSAIVRQNIETPFPSVAECRKTQVWYTCPSLSIERTTLAECLPNRQSACSVVDAMGYIFRGLFCPHGAAANQRRQFPTKVPYLFATMMRRLLNDKNRRPDYLAVVYDHPSPTFRDKLFASYKAQRPPMPDELSIQMPFVRRYCDAMRLPILEYPGYEADDVIGSLARQAEKKILKSSSSPATRT